VIFQLAFVTRLRQSGIGSFSLITQDLRPGLSHYASSGLGWWRFVHSFLKMQSFPFDGAQDWLGHRQKQPKIGGSFYWAGGPFKPDFGLSGNVKIVRRASNRTSPRQSGIVSFFLATQDFPFGFAQGRLGLSYDAPIRLASLHSAPSGQALRGWCGLRFYIR